ncbi:carbon-nitrogen hydrolase family protein [Echinicola soli]|uniref:Carbon-nitrogen hydrolase family protein n=1 Tax=Echinicola soli TaxID=2591634 RepID=A0A514CK12_9BACT|nr:carbon-nitrogen hydrolase family protein [Echinicola soli]QDH80004.1 carbon-nitrogen hydrolase family protein [Echinicola soli]
MNISLVQLSPATGEIDKNIISHVKWIEKAASEHSELVIFPELSLTGYEPTLAKELSITKDDPRLKVFQQLSDNKAIIIAIGAPLQGATGTSISLLIFHPKKEVQVYSKQFLHADELPFFVPGISRSLLIDDTAIGLAICYEISVGEHIKNVMATHPSFFISSVAKDQNGVINAYQKLSEIANKNKLPVAMVNCVGEADGVQFAGKSAFWDDQGNLVQQLDNHAEGILSMKI